MKIFIHHNLRIWTSLDSWISQIPDSGVSQVHDSRVSHASDSRVSHVCDSRTSQVPNILKWVDSSSTEAWFGNYFHTFSGKLAKHLKHVRISSRFPYLIKLSLSPLGASRTCFMNFGNPTFWGCKTFTQFLNTSPSGKRFDSDDPVPQKLLNFGKKHHPQNVRVDTRPPENSQRSSRGGFL
jgi:hypothetical protein